MSHSVLLALALYPKDERFMEMTESGMCEPFTITTTDMVSLPGLFEDVVIVPVVQRAKCRCFSSLQDTHTVTANGHISSRGAFYCGAIGANKRHFLLASIL